jgi:hypothetical protein
LGEDRPAKLFASHPMKRVIGADVLGLPDGSLPEAVDAAVALDRLRKESGLALHALDHELRVIVNLFIDGQVDAVLTEARKLLDQTRTDHGKLLKRLTRFQGQLISAIESQNAMLVAVVMYAFIDVFRSN